MNKDEVVEFLDWYHKKDGSLIGHVFYDIAEQYLQEKVNKNDSIYLVTQRSELLISFMDWIKLDNPDVDWIESAEIVENYKKEINCG